MRLMSVPGAMWFRIGSFSSCIFVLSATFQMVNEHFDRAAPEAIEATLVRKRVLYNPFRIDIIDVTSADGKSYGVSVLPKLANELSVGDRLDIVKMPGLLGKPWAQIGRASCRERV